MPDSRFQAPRADRAELDKPLQDAVQTWMAEAWPFQKPDYAAR